MVPAKIEKYAVPSAMRKHFIKQHALKIASELCHTRIWFRSNFDVYRTSGTYMVMVKIRQIRGFGA